jgi:hypothetical protein
MATDQDLRPSYYEDQYLGADDLEQAVSYGHVQLARHELGAHTWGITTGLELIEKPRPGGGNRVDVYVTPGCAWDGYGRGILVLAPAAVPESLFANIQFDPQNADDTSGKGRLIPIWLQYAQEGLRVPPRGFESCLDGDHTSRIQETFRIVAGQFGRSDQHGSVLIDGIATDPREAFTRFNTSAPKLWDESVPQQEYPDNDPPPRWLVSIGAVRWLPSQGGSGQFVKRDDSGTKPDSDAIREYRRYAGIVAESIEGAGGVIRLRNRFKDPAGSFFHPPQITIDPAKPPENEVAWVEGDLRVVGDTRIAGGKLAFRAPDGKDEDTPIEIRRSSTAQGPGNRTLQIIIGADPQDTNRFAIGRVKADQTIDQKFVVTSEGKVGIATTTPSARLSIQGTVPEHGTLNVFSSTSDFEFDGGNDKRFIFRNTNNDGQTSFMGGDVGINTTTPRARLEVNGDLLVTGRINGHDLDAELQAQAPGVKAIEVVQGEIAHNANIWFQTGTGRMFDERILTLKSITLPGAIPGAWYEIECSYVPIQGTIPPGAVRGRVTVRCQQKMNFGFGTATVAETHGVGAYTVIGWDV